MIHRILNNNGVHLDKRIYHFCTAETRAGQFGDELAQSSQVEDKIFDIIAHHGEPNVSEDSSEISKVSGYLAVVLKRMPADHGMACVTLKSHLEVSLLRGSVSQHHMGMGQMVENIIGIRYDPLGFSIDETEAFHCSRVYCDKDSLPMVFRGDLHFSLEPSSHPRATPGHA